MTSPRGLVQAVTNAMPPDNGMRVGKVASLSPLKINVGGGLLPAGVLGSYTPSLRDTVALIRQDQTWLVLGTIGSPAADVPQQVLARARTDDLTRSSTTTLAADDTLVVPVAANATYALTAFIMYTSTTVADFKFDFLCPVGSNYALNVHTFQASGAAGTQGNDTRVSFNTALGIPGGGTSFVSERTQMTIVGELATQEEAGDCAFRWSQNTSEASNTILRNSSWLRLERMA